ncbi:MAG: ABC transporter ATP-binding protein [candidate division WOR-3 bacterium]|nr:ABC transporter ATP-binding protein [candidate division WOR-3 bacterium]
MNLTTNTQQQTTILHLINITRTFDGVKALDSLSFEISKQSITAIIGPNGSGKTTLFNVITKFLKPDTGKVIFKGKNITYLAPYKISNIGIGRTFQTIRIFPQITVMENMLLALEKGRIEGLFYGLNPFIKHSSKELERKAEELLSKVELKDKINEYAGNLSHGQRRLLEIMRAVALNADLYLFDEPTAGVFPEVRIRILTLFKSLKEEGKTIIFVEHNMETVREGAERVIVLDKGKIIADGEPKIALESEKVIEAYFGG